MHIVIFEGNHWPTFAPLSLTRPVFQLATGMSSLLDKQIRHLKPARLSLWVRPELAEMTRTRIVPRLGLPTTVNEPLNDEPAMLVSGRSLHFRQRLELDLESAVVDDGEVLRYAYTKRPGLCVDDVLNRTPVWRKLLELPSAEPRGRMVDYLWDLVSWNEESLIEDFAHLSAPSGEKPPGAYHYVGDADQLWLGEGVRLSPGAVLDASKGPIILGKGASIGANSVIEGPCYIGAGAQILPQALIRPGTSVGMMCKVAGEIGNSVLFGYSNKAHYGYLGDSYVGKWVNLGAGTTTSNLKNTYGLITARGGDGELQTDRRFLGACIGDHAKTAIETRLPAGAYVGFGSMVAVAGTTPKFVRSLSFLTDAGRDDYRLESFIEVVKRVYARRDREVDAMDETIVRYAAEASKTIEQ